MHRTLDLYATQRLVELLSNIEHQIAYAINESIRYRNQFPVSYLDFGSTNDTISFITANKYDDIQKNNSNEWTSMVWKEKRSEMKIGKLIKMFYQGQFPVNQAKGQPRPKPLADIESFVNKFKAEREKDVNYERFEIVNGTKFQFWYSQENYSRFVHEETTLGRSCLRYKESSKFLRMYSTNKGTFSMLILKDDANKLRGRANLWVLEEPEGRIYMDRIYSVNDFDVELFKDYAKQEGWLHKESQTYGWSNNIVDTKTGEIHNWDKMTMLAKIKKVPIDDYKYYPYLDTLSIYNTKEHTLTNDGRLRVLEPHLLLTDYQGSYHNEVDGRERVNSTVYNEFIVRDEAKFVEIDDSWVYESDAVYVHNTGGKHAYRHSEKIVESNIYKRKYFLKEVAVYSKYLGTHVHKDSVRTAYLDEEKSQEVQIHYKMVGIEFEEKGGDIIKKKTRQNQKNFSNYSTSDREMVEEILHNLSNNSFAQNRRRRSGGGRTASVGRDLYGWGESDSGTTQAPLPQVDNGTEEDGSPLNAVGLDRYSDEVQQYLFEILEEQRRERVRRGENPSAAEPRIRFTATQGVQMGRPMVTDEPERVERTERVGRSMWQTIEEPTEQPVEEDTLNDLDLDELEREVTSRLDGMGTTLSDNETADGGDVDGTVSTNNASARYINYGSNNYWYQDGTPSGNTSSYDIQNLERILRQSSGIPSSYFGNLGSTDNEGDDPTQDE